MRMTTAMWGGAFVLEAMLRVWIVFVLSPDQVVVVGTTMAVAVTASLVVATRFAMKGIRKRVETEGPSAWPT